MAEGRRSDVAKSRNWEAECNSLIEIENINRNEREVRQGEDVKEDKEAGQAMNQTSPNCSHRDEGKQRQPEQDCHNEQRENGNERESTDNVMTSTSTSKEKEEGNYEELICLVRQFYVERPVNPAAIAYQNIETC